VESGILRRSSAAAAVAVLATLAGAVGCGPTKPRPVSLAEGARSYTSADYGRVVNRWTRHALLQKDFDRVAPFDTALDVRATFKSWDWRWAYVERYADYYKLPANEKDKLRESELKDAGSFHEFHVAASASRFEWAEFVSRKTSIWRVVLFDDRGHEVEPSDILPVRAPIIQETAFFPYVGGIDQPFLTRTLFQFPRELPNGGGPTLSPEASQFTLRFTGPLGTVDLVWQTTHERKE
jgi:hypothetical protein